MNNRLAELRALLAKATPGPWWKDGWSRVIASDERETIISVPPPGCSPVGPGVREDAALIVAAVNELPALLDVAEAAERLRIEKAAVTEWARHGVAASTDKLSAADEALFAALRAITDVIGGEK